MDTKRATMPAIPGDHPDKGTRDAQTRAHVGPTKVSRTRSRQALATAVLCLCLLTGGAAQPTDYDLLIRNGRIVDGTGNPWFMADLAIREGRIVALGRLQGRATRTIDASGLVVAPGFIDIHNHSDDAVVVDPDAQSRSARA